MNEQAQDNRSGPGATGEAGQPGRETGRSSRLSAFRFLAALLGSLLIVVAVLLVVSFVTGDRLRQRSQAAPGEVRRSAPAHPLPAGRREGVPSSKRAAPVPRDAVHDSVARMLSYLSAADLGAGKQSGDDSEEDDHPDLAERLRLAGQMFPIEPEGQGAEPPDDLELPDTARIITVSPYGDRGSGQTLVMVRMTGSKAAVRDFFSGQAKANGWNCTEQPAATEGVVTLLVEKGGGERMITIYERLSGAECVVGICDLGGG